MSNFTISRAHVDYLVSLGRALGAQCEGLNPFTEPDRVGQRLWDLNYRSVNYAAALRSPRAGKKKCPAYTWQASPLLRATPGLDPAEIPRAAKLVHCYRAQTDSAPGWFGNGEAGNVRAWTEYLIDKLIRQLPGYEEAPWVI